MNDWLEIVGESQGAGSAVKTIRTVLANKGRNVRSKIITAQTTGGKQASVSVDQAGAEVNVTIQQTTITVANGGTSVLVEGTSNARVLVFALTSATHFHLPATVEVFIGGVSIGLCAVIVNGSTGNVSAIPPNDPGAAEEYTFKLTLTVDANNTVAQITDTLTVTAPGSEASDSVSLVHEAATSSISLSPSAITLSVDSGSSMNLTLTSNDDWELSIEDITTPETPSE